MAVVHNKMDERMGEFRRLCEAHGLKVTHQRMEIYRALAATAEHPDVEAIHARVRKRIPTISLDTVYRNLKLLAEHGILSIVGMSQERLRFDANMESHHHFTCVKCGLIRDFITDELKGLAIPDEAKTFGEPVSLHIEVKGICASCTRKAK